MELTSEHRRQQDRKVPLGQVEMSSKNKLVNPDIKTELSVCHYWDWRTRVTPDLESIFQAGCIPKMRYQTEDAFQCHSCGYVRIYLDQSGRLREYSLTNHMKKMIAILANPFPAKTAGI